MLFFNRCMQGLAAWLAEHGVRRTCPHVAGACRDSTCCCGLEAVATCPPTQAEEPTPSPKEETGDERQADPDTTTSQEQSTARLIVGTRKDKKTKKGKKGKHTKLAAAWAAM